MKYLLFSAIALFTAPRGADAMSQATQATINDGLHLLYNLDYAEARARVRQLTQQEPDNPYGYLFEASVIWWQSDNEYGLFKDTPTLENLFETDISETLERGAAALRTPMDEHQKAEVYFAMGMALGVKGQWNLLRRRWIKAYFEGRKAVKYLHKCLKLDPNFYDAYLGLGIYDYQADRLPGILKLSALLMVHGNAQRGLAEMQSAMDHGTYVSNQAAEFMATLYAVNERDYERALSLTRILRDRFPESPYFQMLETVLLYQLKDIDGSYKAALPLLDKASREPTLTHRKLLSLLCGLTDDKCLSPEEVSLSIDWFTHALETDSPRQTPRTTLLHFYRGIAYDMSENRHRAVEDYERCLKGPVVPDVQEMARHCLAATCTRAEVMQQLKSMSLDH